MNRISPLHLRTLLAIAHRGSFRAAAEQLGTTQPGISSRMRELEGQLGTALFERDGRRMILTARGRQLVSDCEPVLAELDRVLLRASAQSTASGMVRLGAGEIASASCVPALVREAAGAFPKVTLDVKVDLTARMLENLLAGRIDLVFFAGPIAHPAIRTASVGSLDLVWLTSPACPGKTPPALWTLPAHSPIHHIVREEVALHGIPHRSLNNCNNVRALIDILAAGGGIGLLPETMTRAERESGALYEFRPRPKQRIEFQAAIRKRQSDSVVLKLFDFAGTLEVDPAT